MSDFICQICNKPCKTKSALYNHIKLHKISTIEYNSKFNIALPERICIQCGNVINRSHAKLYCSKQCMKNDLEFLKGRNTKIKNDKSKILKCKMCDWQTVDINNLGGYPCKHLKTKHNINTDNYLSYYNLIDAPIKIKPFSCPLCDWKSNDPDNKSGWFTIHLNTVHNLTIDEFINKYPEYSHLWKLHVNQKKRTELLSADAINRIQCKECGEYFQKITKGHLDKHGLSITEYKTKYGLSNLWSKRLINITSKHTTKYNLNNGSAFTHKTSTLETKFSELLQSLNINYVSPFIFQGKRYDFLLIDHNLVIEIDGIAWHLNELKNMNLHNINNSINDYTKNSIIYNSIYTLKRVRFDNQIVPNISTVNQLLNYIDALSYNPSYELNYDQIIISKCYFESYIQNKGADKLRSYIPLLLKFIRTFQPTFPYPTTTVKLTDVMNKLTSVNYSHILTDNNFKNSCSIIGIDYLKANFKSYWQDRKSVV